MFRVPCLPLAHPLTGDPETIKQTADGATCGHVPFSHFSPEQAGTAG